MFNSSTLAFGTFWVSLMSLGMYYVWSQLHLTIPNRAASPYEYVTEIFLIKYIYSVDLY